MIKPCRYTCNTIIIITIVSIDFEAEKEDKMVNHTEYTDNPVVKPNTFLFFKAKMTP